MQKSVYSPLAMEEKHKHHWEQSLRVSLVSLAHVMYRLSATSEEIKSVNLTV